MSTDFDIRAISTLNAYPLKKIRNDMSSHQYMEYVNDWNTFNRIWAFNYTVSTIKSSPDSYAEDYKFVSNNEYLSYLRGQQAHFAVYRSAPPQQFDTPK